MNRLGNFFKFSTYFKNLSTKSTCRKFHASTVSQFQISLNSMKIPRLITH